MNNTKYTKEQIRERIQQKKILFDGAFGTYYGGKYDTRSCRSWRIWRLRSG